METMNLGMFLAALGRSSLQAGVLVLVVLLAQWLLRKRLSPRWRCALWLLVVGRLLLPISVASVVSIFNLLPRWTDRSTATSANAVTAPMAVPQRVTLSVLPVEPQLGRGLGAARLQSVQLAVIV